MRRRRKSSAMRGPTLGICSNRITDSLLFGRRLLGMSPRSERGEADDVTTRLSDVELRRSIERLMTLLHRGRPPDRRLDFIEIADRRHRDEQRGAVAGEIAP